MIIFLDDILNGNIETLLGSDLYAETISKIVVWWAVLPLAGLILAFICILLSFFWQGVQTLTIHLSFNFLLIAFILFVFFFILKNRKK